MFTHQTLIQALESDDIYEALKDIEAACIQSLKQEGVSVLHLVLEAMADKICSQLNTLNSQASDGMIPNPDYVLLLTKIIAADPFALHKKFNGQRILDVLSKEIVIIDLPEFGSKEFIALNKFMWLGGSSGLKLTKSATSLALFLLKQGAGLGYELNSSATSFKIPATQFSSQTNQPILFIGASPHPFHYCWQREEYFFSLAHVLNFINKKKLSKLEISQLLYQAEQGKKYAVLNQESKKELQKVINLLYTSELTTLFLQVVHQIAQVFSSSPGLPKEMMMKIVGYMLGISEAETDMLYQQKVQEHAKKLQLSGCLQSLTLFKTKLSGIIEIDFPEESKLAKVSSL